MTDIYLDVLRFLTTKHSFAEVDRQFRSAIQKGTTQNGSQVNPGVYVDKLAHAGGIAFDDGWLITKEGRGLLKQLES